MTKLPNARSSDRRGSPGLVWALIGAAGLLTIGAVYYLQPASGEPSIPPGTNLSSWFDNGSGGRSVVRIYQGDAPPVGIQAVGSVLTDTNCEPDTQGLSHCHNVIDLGNGRRVEVVHTHYMSQHPCLAPGDKLSITRLDADWLITSAREQQGTD